MYMTVDGQEVIFGAIAKGKEIATSSKGFKRFKKGVAPSSSFPRASPARRFGAK
ncbi:hypothetical protein HAX54_033168, partial [Datura stramonium]|nr:hypothetical protein [Datura stramonium]